MTETRAVIEALATSAAPVRRVGSPYLRAALWLGFGLIVVMVLTGLHGARADLAARLGQPAFGAGLLAAVLTAALAALAAFMLCLPDRSRLWLLLPVPAAVAWVGCVGFGCLGHWVPIGPGPLDPREALRCFSTLLLCGVPLTAGMFWMLRHGASLRPRAAMLAGAGAAGALSSAALALIHVFDASALVLVWNFGSAALVMLADAVVARLVLHWA